MKRIFTIFLSVLMIISSVLSASAATFTDAAVGDKVVFKDANWAYEKVNVYGWEIDEYIGSANEVELPWSFAKEYVTSIGSYAFNRSEASSVKTTGVLETIDDYAFNDSSSLQKLELYPSLKSIGVGCFYGDKALTDINLNVTSITEVSAYCFANCGIRELALPETCLSIGNMAFYNCSSLTKLTIPDSVTSIADTAFRNCDGLVIYCYTDSYAQEYAETNGMDYVLLDAPETLTFILGDADGDGEVTISDATVVQRVLVGITEDHDGMIGLRAAVDGDQLNISHATKIQRYLADLNVIEPINTEVTRIIPSVMQDQ